MSTSNEQVALNIEERLNQLNLTPSERADALGALRVAEEAVELLEILGAAVKRIAGAFSPKPSVRA